MVLILLLKDAILHKIDAEVYKEHQTEYTKEETNETQIIT